MARPWHHNRRYRERHPANRQNYSVQNFRRPLAQRMRHEMTYPIFSFR